MASAVITSGQYKAMSILTNIFGGLATSVTWRLDGESNIAEIQVPRKRFHEFRQYNAGKRVYIKARRNYTSATLFNGWITGRYFDFSPDNELVTVVCAGPRWYLQGDYVKGRLMLNQDSIYRNLNGHKAIFNEQVKGSTAPTGNGAVTKITTGTFSGVRAFSINPKDAAQSTPYTVNEMLWYCFKVGTNARDPKTVDETVVNFSQFGVGEIGELKIYDVNVDGMNVTEAMTEIFRKAGLRWWCKPITETLSEIKAFVSGPDTETNDNEIIVGVNRDDRVKYLYLADVASGVTPPTAPTLATIDNSVNNVEAGRCQEDFADAFNRVHVYGDRKVFQQEFTLVPGWSASAWASLSAQDIAAIRKEMREKTASWGTNPTYRDIGRKWILDEDGSVSGSAHDFSTLFGHGSWARVARPFLGERVDATNFSAIQAKMSGGSWRVVEANVQVLKDKAGIYIEGDELPAEILDEKTKTLATQLKITIPLHDDQALNKIAYVDGEQGGYMVGIVTGDNADQIDRRICVIEDSEYTWDNVNTTKASEAEANLTAFATRKLREHKDPRLSASFSIPWICLSYEPGDIVQGIKGRDLWFTGQIVEVRFDLGEVQRTELVLEDLRLAES